MELRERLLSGQDCIAVIGCGYIGVSTCMAYAQQGVRVVGYDIDKERIAEYRKGVCSLPMLEDWLGSRLADHLDLIEFTTNFEDVIERKPRAFFVAVNTEKRGEPWLDAFNEVLGKIKLADWHPLVVVESTLVPRTLRLHVSANYDLASAPRRDWFVDRTKNLKNLPRVYSASSQQATVLTRELLGIVCDVLHEASSLEVAELVKATENAIQHVQMMFASELALAYPDLDTNEVMRLAGEHWRLGGKWFRPGLGAGGYCIPTASKYLSLGAKHSEYLGIARQALHVNDFLAGIVADRCSKFASPVAILGFSYKEDIKIPVLSVSIKLANEFLKRGCEVRIFDPYYTRDEIRQWLGRNDVSVASKFEELKGSKLVFVLSPHKIIRSIPVTKVQAVLSGAIILDETGCWQRYAPILRRGDIQYWRIGEPGWLRN